MAGGNRSAYRASLAQGNALAVLVSQGSPSCCYPPHPVTGTLLSFTKVDGAS
jgi:hypothetical protein